MSAQYSQIDINKGIELYKQGISVTEAAKITGVPYSTLHGRVKECVGSVRNHSDAARLAIGYDFNEKIFDTWSMESAWLLGWIITDGTVSRSDSQSEVKIEITDKDVCDKISRMMGGNKPVSDRIKEGFSGKPCHLYSIRYGSKYMVDKLISFGVTPNKSHRVFPPNISKEYLPDLFRGLIEGDGGFLYQPEKSIHRTYFYTCSDNMKNWFISTMKNEIGINFSVELAGVYRDEYSCCIYNLEDCRKLINWIYHPNMSYLYMDSKYNLAKSLIGLI